MKTVLLVCIVCMMTFLSCTKDKKTYPSSILAGLRTGEGIKFEDLIPDDSIGDYVDREERLIDMNSDGVADFKLYSGHTQASGFGNGGSWIIPLDSNAIACQINTNFIDTLSVNDVIGSGNYWVKATCVYYYYSYSQENGGINHGEEGLWRGVSEKYAAVRIKKDDNYLYGWLRINMNMHYSQILLDYAITTGY